MARRKLDVNVRLERQEKKILRIKAELEEEQKVYEELLKEKKEEDKKKLFEAYQKSRRSLEEVIDFMNGKADI